MSCDHYDEFFSSTYGELQSESACAWFVAKSHRALERGLGRLPLKAKVLEVGGNLGEHLQFVKHSYEEYLVTDIRDTGFQSDDKRVRFEVADVENLPYPDSSIDRVVLTCVLHHVTDVHRALVSIRRVVRPQGLVSVMLPCDPGLAYRIAKTVGPYRSLRKLGSEISAQFCHYQQHRNHFPGISAAIKEVFSEDQVRTSWWPFPIRSWNLNLFAILQIRIAERSP